MICATDGSLFPRCPRCRGQHVEQVCPSRHCVRFPETPCPLTLAACEEQHWLLTVEVTNPREETPDR